MNIQEAFEALRKAEGRATPPPWIAEYDGAVAVSFSDGGPRDPSALIVDRGVTDGNKDFIALSRNTYRELLRLAEAAVAECEARRERDTPTPWTAWITAMKATDTALAAFVAAVENTKENKP